MKGKKRRLMRILVPVLCILCIAIGAVAFFRTYEPYNRLSITEDPEGQLVKSFQKTAAALEDGMAFSIPETLGQAVSNGAISTTLRGDGATITNTLYLRDGYMATMGDITTDGQESPAKYALYLDEENIALDIPAVLDNTVYGINGMTLKEDLKDSALLEMLGLSYEQAAEVLDAIFSMKEAEEEQTGGKDWASMLEMKTRLETLLDSCAVAVDDGSLNTDMGTISVYRISYAMTPAQMCEAMDILFNWVITTDGYKTISEDTEDMTQQLQSSLEELKKEIVASNATAVLNFYLHGKTQIITQAELRIDWFVEKEVATFAIVAKLGENPVESLHYTMNISMNHPEDGKESVYIDYERSHAHNLPGRKLTITSGEETVTIMEIQVNKVTNAFELKLFDRDLELSGVCKSEKGKISLTLHFDEETTAEIVFHAAAQAPKMPAYTKLTSLTELELMKLFAQYLGEREVELTICDTEGYEEYDYLYHTCWSLGNLLETNQIATLDEDGHIITVNGFDVSAANPTSWKIFVDGEEITENLYEVILDYYAEITLLPEKKDA